jgi:hypothetical protein
MEIVRNFDFDTESNATEYYLLELLLTLFLFKKIPITPWIFNIREI